MRRNTPVRQQYLDIKEQHKDAILFFRLGDFYEMFDEDAEVAARELDITLTSRADSNGPKIPMAGVPYHSAEPYIARLIEKGYRVAICEQMHEPDGRGPVERQVVRVVTPGTLIESDLLREDQPNYLMAVLPIGDPLQRQWQRVGIAYTDISTGEFSATELSGDNAALLVLEEMSRLTPREIIMPESWATPGVSLPEGIHLTPVQDWNFEYATAVDTLCRHFRVQTLDGFGLKDLQAATGAAGAVLHYLRATQMNSLAQLNTLRTYSTESFMVLDQFTRRNLELTETLRERRSKGSLLGTLDRTVTSMGARLLRSWISQPLLEAERINARLDAVEALRDNEGLRMELQETLKQVSDIERLTNRLIVKRVGPRDLLGLRTSLQAIPTLIQLTADTKQLISLHSRLDPCPEVDDLISRALTNEPPATLNTTGVIRPTYSPELTDLLEKSRHAREWIDQLETKERARTGISSLKVVFNKLNGYYIEVTHANIGKVPADYVQKMTMTNANRYITSELKEYETLVLNAEEQILALERRLFDELCALLVRHTDRLLKTARAIAYLDTLLSLADVAAREGYTRPEITTNDLLVIKGGRHPVVEQSLASGVRYTPNDTDFDTLNRIHIITGPNMSGKSTYIRQVAVIALMAQIGSFVPADEATIGLVDRIFARIGAQDEIHAGQSTFMVEMVETARLLSGSTRRSLLILDEVGRGTSTYDGLAIARAVIEYIHNSARLNCRTLFATHYHELTALPNILQRVRNYNVAVSEQGDNIVFLHRVIPGGANRSYGVHVAQLAGMPAPVVERARQLLQELEAEGRDFKTNEPRHKKPKQTSMFAPPENPAVEALRELNVEELTPIEALNKLYELKKLAD